MNHMSQYIGILSCIITANMKRVSNEQWSGSNIDKDIFAQTDFSTREIFSPR